MTFDNLDTWRIIYSQFVSAASKSGISFVPNNYPEAQDGCKVRIITTEMSHGNGPWAMALVTLRDLDQGNCIWLLDIH